MAALPMALGYVLSAPGRPPKHVHVPDWSPYAHAASHVRVVRVLAPRPEYTVSLPANTVAHGRLPVGDKGVKTSCRDEEEVAGIARFSERVASGFCVHTRAGAHLLAH